MREVLSELTTTARGELRIPVEGDRWFETIIVSDGLMEISLVKDDGEVVLLQFLGVGEHKVSRKLIDCREIVLSCPDKKKEFAIDARFYDAQRAEPLDDEPPPPPKEPPTLLARMREKARREAFFPPREDFLEVDMPSYEVSDDEPDEFFEEEQIATDETETSDRVPDSTGPDDDGDPPEVVVAENERKGDE